jgi:hypothetical protein
MPSQDNTAWTLRMWPPPLRSINGGARTGIPRWPMEPAGTFPALRRTGVAAQQAPPEWMFPTGRPRLHSDLSESVTISHPHRVDMSHI